MISMCVRCGAFKLVLCVGLCFWFVTYGDSDVTFRLSYELWNKWRTSRTQSQHSKYQSLGYYSASVYSTPIFTTCRTETHLDDVFSSISGPCKVVLCHACRSHSNHMALPSTLTFFYSMFCVFIFPWIYRPPPKEVLDMLYFTRNDTVTVQML
jgi:hypothetical protein